MRPENALLPNRANLPWNKPTVVYPDRPAHQQEKSHMQWGELVDYCLISDKLTIDEYVEYQMLLSETGLQDIGQINVFQRCENCYFEKNKVILPFTDAIVEIAGEWNIPYSKYSRVLDLMSDGYLSRFLGWKAVL